jgi:hypothetical protein
MKCLLSILTRCFAVLYVGASMFLITGQFGMLGLCNFNCVFIIGSEGFFWVRYFIFCLFMIKLHCLIVYCMSFLYLSDDGQ